MIGLAIYVVACVVALVAIYAATLVIVGLPLLSIDAVCRKLTPVKALPPRLRKGELIQLDGDASVWEVLHVTPGSAYIRKQKGGGVVSVSPFVTRVSVAPKAGQSGRSR